MDKLKCLCLGEDGKWHLLPQGFPLHLLKKYPNGRLGFNYRKVFTDMSNEYWLLWNQWSVDNLSYDVKHPKPDTEDHFLLIDGVYIVSTKGNTDEQGSENGPKRRAGGNGRPAKAVANHDAQNKGRRGRKASGSRQKR